MEDISTKDESVTQLNNYYKTVYRTAPAIPGLLIINVQQLPLFRKLRLVFKGFVIKSHKTYEMYDVVLNEWMVNWWVYG